MSIHLVTAYWIGLVGAVVGLAVGLIVPRLARRSSQSWRWHGRVTLPLILAAAGAHLALIPAVEQQRQVMFGLYGAALIGVVVFALLGFGIWRLGAIVFPLGSIGAYFYFGLMVHQVDYIGLLVKLVEVAAIAAVLVPVFGSRASSREVTPAA